jgi:hypothetical protein
MTTEAADVAEAEERSDEDGSAAPKAERQPVSFEFTTDGPAWKGIPVVNGRELFGVERIDVELDARNLPKVTMRLSVASGLKISAATAVACLDDGTVDALVSLGWTPPGDAVVTKPGQRAEITEA